MPLKVHKGGIQFPDKLKRQRAESKSLLRTFIEIVDIVLRQGGSVTFEWPRDSYGWLQPSLLSFIRRWKLRVVDVAACAVGAVGKRNRPVSHTWRFVTSEQYVADALDIPCPHKSDFRHD